MDFRVKQVVNIQALVRGRQIRFKYTKSKFKSESLQMHNKSRSFERIITGSLHSP